MKPSIRTHGSLSLIRVFGNQIERARQHASLLKDRIPKGVVPILAQRNQWMIRRGPGFARAPGVSQSAVWIYEKALIPWLTKQLPKEYLQITEALGEGSGVPAKSFLHSLLQPDGLLLLARMTTMKHLLKEFSPHTIGCSSAIVPGSWTKTGESYHSAIWITPSSELGKPIRL